jgi:hypothetical protein
MARFTQFFGLSKEAKERVEDAEIIATYKGTEGIAGEPVEFMIFKVKNTYDYDGIEMEDFETYAEVMQAEPWSSGPCIFTCLINLRKPAELLYLWDRESIENC